MLKLSIFNQRLSYFSDSEVVADSKGYLTFTLETSEDWATYVGKTVQFTRNGVTYNVTNIMDNVEYVVPWEVLKGAGIMYVNAFAVKETGKRATTNQIQVEITESGLNEDSLAPTDPTPDIFQQYVQAVQKSAKEAKESADSAKTSANSAKKDADRAQQYFQQTEQIKQDIIILNGQAQQHAQNAFQYANSAKKSAEQASKSEIAAASSAADAKQYAQDAKQSETNAKQSETNAKQSETNAKQSADRAEANQQIVTETKNEIDIIYNDIKQKHTDVTNKHSEVLVKSEQVNEQALKVEEWYNKFQTGVKYTTFTENMQTETLDGWQLDSQSGDYILSIGDSSQLVMSVQVLQNGNYFITPFCDIVLTAGELILHSIVPFAGRVATHTLIKVQEVV